MPPEFQRSRPIVLMISPSQLERDNVRVLLRTMECRCPVASSLPEALVLLKKQEPDAAILDPQLLVSSCAEVLAAVHKIVLRLQRRVVILTRGEGDSRLPVLDAYSLPNVPVDLLFQELWPCLDSLLRRNCSSKQGVRGARLVFDSELQPLPAGVRATQPAEHTLVYESGDVMVDLRLESYRDSPRIQLVGQVLQDEKAGSQLCFLPIVLQSQEGLVEATTTNELGEFQLDFHLRPRLRLEVGVREHHWVSIELPDSRYGIRGT